VLPGVKITKQITDIRGVEIGKDVLSLPNHSAVGTVAEMVEFIE
jgi:glutamate synthase domain-containing protein 2